MGQHARKKLAWALLLAYSTHVSLQKTVIVRQQRMTRHEARHFSPNNCPDIQLAWLHCIHSNFEISTTSNQDRTIEEEDYDAPKASLQDKAGIIMAFSVATPITCMRGFDSISISTTANQDKTIRERALRNSHKKNKWSKTWTHSYSLIFHENIMRYIQKRGKSWFQTSNVRFELSNLVYSQQTGESRTPCRSISIPGAMLSDSVTSIRNEFFHPPVIHEMPVENELSHAVRR